MDARKVMKSTGNQAMSWTVESVPAGGRSQRSKHEICDDVHHGGGDDLVEGVLEEATEPAPEQPFELRNDKERYEDRSHQHADRGGDEAVSDDHNRHGLGRGEQDRDDDVDGGAKDISPTWGVHAGFEIGDLRNDGLKLGLIDLAGQELGLIGDEIVEAGARCRGSACCSS